MENTKDLGTVVYMLRHLLTANVTDPLSNASRGNTIYTQYFSGTGSSGQINYLERKPVSTGNFVVTIDGTEKYNGSDFTLDESAMTITWAATTPADDTDNIKVEYSAIKSWIYDDHPNLNVSDFPRVTVDVINYEYESMGIGSYTSYASRVGDRIKLTVKVVIRNRQGGRAYTYGGVQYKNMDLVNKVASDVINYFQTNRYPIPWKFHDWKVVRSERIKTEEDSGIYRNDITLYVWYMDNDI